MKIIKNTSNGILALIVIAILIIALYFYVQGDGSMFQKKYPESELTFGEGGLGNKE